MYLERVSASSEVTVPAAALAALGLVEGDAVMIVVQSGEIIIGRADDPFINPFATFTEWADEADTEAYCDL